MKARMGSSGSSTDNSSSLSDIAGSRSCVTSEMNFTRSAFAKERVTRPACPRARKRRFWERRVKWRSSRSAFPMASRYSSAGRSSSSTTSREPRITVSGVRSSWETSAMNCCCSFSAEATASRRALSASATSRASPVRSVAVTLFSGCSAVSAKRCFSRASSGEEAASGGGAPGRPREKSPIERYSAAAGSRTR